MDARAVLIGLNEIQQIGWETIAKLVEHCVPLTGLLDPAKRAQTMLRARIPEKRASAISSQLSAAFIQERLQRYASQGIDIYTVWDAQYPALLRQIDHPPWVLYAQGDWSLVHRPCVAVVGTRNPTPYGCEIATWIGHDLAKAGVTVVSGLARGIDTMAHRGALQAEGATIAVLGNGVHVCYPPEHHAIQRKIAKQGIVMSPFPWHARPAKHAFLLRNRIIAGLSVGTVVVEATVDSGSLHTADCALAFNREVMGVPGPICAKQSEGVLARLREGATLIHHPQHILDACNIARQESTIKERIELKVALTETEQRILTAMGATEVTMDEILARTAVPFGDVHATLLSLLRKRRIRALSGSAYIAIAQ